MQSMFGDEPTQYSRLTQNAMRARPSYLVLGIFGLVAILMIARRPSTPARRVPMHSSVRCGNSGHAVPER